MISVQLGDSIRAISVLAFSTLFLFGCTSEDESWENAKEANSAEVYSEFVEDFNGLAHWGLQESVRSLHIEAFRLLKEGDDEYAASSAVYSRILRVDPDNAHALNNMAYILLASVYDAPTSERKAIIQKARKLTERAFNKANRRAISPQVTTRAHDGWYFSALQVADHDVRSSSLRGMVGDNLEQVSKPLDKPFSFPDFPLKALAIRGTVRNKNGEPLANEELWLSPSVLQVTDDDASPWSISTNSFFDKAGKLANPSTITDNNGAFIFTIDDDAERLLEPYTGKTLGIFVSKSASNEDLGLPIFKFDVPIVFQPDPDVDSMELGDLALSHATTDLTVSLPETDSEASFPVATGINEKQRREELLREATNAAMIQAKETNAARIEGAEKKVDLDAIVPSTACSDSTDAGELTTRTPEKLFRSILALSKDQCFEKIRPLLVSIPSDERMRDAGYRDSQDMAIEMIKAQAYPSNGDMAYSNAGLEVLIEQHLDKFSTMPSKFHKRMREEDPYASVPDVQETLENDPDGFMMMAYSGVNIIVVRVRGNYRLLFWEHLPRLAGGQRDE